MNLYEHQQRIVDANPSRTGLWLGTGSGKTRTALALAVGRVLVICPKTQRDDGNWQRECEKMGIDVALTVMSKEEFRRDVDKLVDKGITFDTIIVDEAHTCLGVTPNTHQKNKMQRPKASQLFYALKQYIHFCKPQRLYLVTATVVKSPMTVWGAGVILGKYSMDSFYRFRNIFYVKLPMAGREIYSAKSDHATKQRLAVAVNKLGFVGQLSDYFDVPDQTFKNEYVDLTAEQTKAIKECKTDFPDPLVQIGKRHQIENGVLAGDEYNPAQVFKENKTARLLEYGIEFPRMIIFCKYTKQIDFLSSSFKKAGKKVFLLTGKTQNRKELFEEVNACEDYVLIAQAQVSAGWEVPDCPVMIFASRTYSFVDYDQAQGRILRANKLKKNLYINLIAKGDVDRAVHKALENKGDFSEKVYAESNN